MQGFVVRTRVLFAVLAVCFAACALGQMENLQDLSTFPRTTLEIRGKSEPQRFNVWVADTAARQTQGLMFVRDLPSDQGMIFINEQPRAAAMWMKNTYIELDMLFVDAQGHIVKIAERTHPLSLATIQTKVPVKAVIELKGGESARRGLRVGDRVTW